MTQENSKKISVHKIKKDFSVIIVTGTPATGKTTLSKLLASKLGYEYLDLNIFSKEHDLVVGFDEKRDCDIIDEEQLSDKVKEYSKYKKLVIDSHMSHYIDKEIVDKCIVTKCDLPELKKRLESRGYNADKVRENLDSEIFDTCNIEAIEEGYNPIIIWTDKDVEEQLNKIL